MIEKMAKDDDTFELLDKLMCELSATYKYIQPDRVAGLLVECSTSRKVDRKIEEMKILANNDERGKDEKVAARTQQKIGEIMLTALKGSRTLFGTIIKSITEMFNTIDTDANGRLDREEFKIFCGRMDFGLSVTQTQEVWATFDADGSGEITFSEFEDMLVTVEASVLMHETKQKPTAAFLLIDTLQHKLGDKEAEGMLVTIFDEALDRRISARTKPSEEGKVKFWEYRARIRHTKTPGLDQGARSNLLKIFDQLFRKLDSKKEACVNVADIAFFLRQLLMKYARLQKEPTMSKHEITEEAKRLLIFRIGRTMLTNFRNSNINLRNADLTAKAEEIFRALDWENQGIITRPVLMRCFSDLNFSLTAPQGEGLFHAIDTNENGVIEITELCHFLKATEKEMRQKEQEKKDAQDPRYNLALINAVVRDVSSGASPGVVVLWCCGVVVLWCCSVVVWCCGVVVCAASSTMHVHNSTLITGLFQA